MRSRLRSTARGNSNEKKLQVTKVYYPQPNDKQFIAYSNVMKQSNSGMASHQRFLLFDSFSKSLRYYSKAPSPLPTPADLPDGKQIVFLKKVRNFEFKSAKTNVGKAIVTWSDLNGQKKSTWNLTFSSNQLMNDWVIIVNQAKQDGHLRPFDRPVVRRETKLRNPEKYETQFIKTTGGIISRKSSSLQKSQNQNPLALSESKNNSDWITKMAIQKEQQIQENRKQFHQIPNSQQKSEDKKQVLSKGEVKKQEKSALPPLFNKPPLITNNNVGGTRNHRISVIPEVEDSSKMSKREYKQLQSQSTKNFRIQRQPPLPIPEAEQPLDQSNIKGMSPEQVKHHQSQNKLSNSDLELTKKLNEKSIAFDEQRQNTIGKFDLKQKIEKLINSDPKTKNGTEDQKNVFIDETKYYPYVYWNFIQKCQQLAVLIIENLATIVKVAEEKPSRSCYIDDEGVLLIQKDSIEFKYKFQNQQGNDDNKWSCSSLKMQHYSSMVEYISRLSHNAPTNYTKVLPIPSCIISHKWSQILCKAIIPVQFNPINRSEEQKLNTFFQIPTGSWIYYSREQSLVVDYAIDKLIINSDPDEETILQICEDMCKEQTQIGHIKDLILYCRSRFCINVDCALILRLLGKIKQDSNRHIFTTLMSILFGIKSAKYIRAELMDKIGLLDSIQMYESIDAYIKAFTIDNKSSINSGIMNLITCELQSKNIYIKKAVPDVHSVFSTIVSVLGLELYKNSSKQENRHCIRFVPIAHTLSGEGLSDQMAKICVVLKNSETPSVSEQAKIQCYQQITNLLNEFQYLWTQSQGANKPKTSSRPSIQQKYRSSYYSNPNTLHDRKQFGGEQVKLQRWANKGKYLNNYYRIMHYKSLYEPYNIHNTSAYSQQLESIFNEQPPSFYSYLVGINCIKWTSKQGVNNHHFVIKMMHDQIENCKEWAGNYSPFLLSYYELYAVYAQQIFDLQSAVQNARYALQLVIQIYGEDSAEAAEKWFLLANILVQGELYEQGLEAYLKSLEVLKMSQTNNGVLSRTITSSRTTLLSWRVNTGQAQFTVHMKLMKIYLALGDTKNCLSECSRCHRAVQQFVEPRPIDELQILNTIVRCYQLTRQYEKLMQMIEIISIQFGNRIINMRLSIDKQSLQFEQNLRERMMKICLSPQIQSKIADENRKNFLLGITKAIRLKYEGRFTKKQYNSYLTKTVFQQSLNQENAMEASKFRKSQAGDKPFNMIQWFVNVFQDLPIFTPNPKSSSLYNPSLDINYNLHQNAINSRIQPVTQPKLLIVAMRIIQALSGILGFSYLESCFSY